MQKTSHIYLDYLIMKKEWENQKNLNKILGKHTY